MRMRLIMNEQNSTAFLTDKYEITMLQALLTAGKGDEPVVFDLFARRLPRGRRYGVVGGINRAIEAVKNFRFTEPQLEMLRNDPIINEETIEFLANYKFTGVITGYAEGSLYFPNSPVLTVQGTLAESILLETVLLSILNYDSAVMSAASRMVNAAEGIPLIEMGTRRASEISAVYASRAAYIAGFNATSNMEAGLRYGIPTTGTAAHAFTLAFDNEKEAFKAQVKSLGTNTTLLVDTYDIEQGIRNAIEVAGPNLGAIRIDSGDLHEETVKARELLNELGATNTKITLSSDINEYTIEEINDRNTPADALGVGTRVVTGSGAPTAEMVFKLVERTNSAGQVVPVAKKAIGKNSIGGLKTPFRTFDKNGIITGEFFKTGANATLSTDEIPMHVTLVENGIYYTEDIETARERHAHALTTLPEGAHRTSADLAAFKATEV